MCILFFAAFITILFASFTRVKADDDPRHYDEVVTVNTMHWQLARWQDGAVVCDFYLQHQSWPTWNDVSQACGSEVAKTWQSTPICQDVLAGGTGTACKGLLLRQVGQSTQSYIREVNLPDIVMQVLVNNCVPGDDCLNHPEIDVVAYEPLAGYKITRVHVRIGDRERIYSGANANIRLPITTDRGDTLLYWAESDFGDDSNVFAVKFRALKKKEGAPYRLDLLNRDWESKLPGGALLWEVFPPSNGSLPKIYERPSSVRDLATDKKYVYLAGYLIRKGLVDASECKDRGVLPNGAATPCGERVSAQKVLEWQNRYDQEIFLASQKYNVPAHVLKALIAQESQYVPESDTPFELGLGRITENGVDMLLSWNNNYFLSTCIPIYESKPCAAGYSNLQPDQRTVVRWSAFNRISTNEEVDLLAAMLYASAAQTRQMVVNVAHTEPANASTYEDMWKMSIANYYSGSGCVGTALKTTLAESKPFLWDNVSTYLLGDCQIAIDYVHKVLMVP